jgi:hypothetical protein
VHHQQIRHDRDVAAWAHDLGLSERQQISPSGTVPTLRARPIPFWSPCFRKAACVQKQHGIIHANRRLQRPWHRRDSTGAIFKPGT